MTDHLADVGGMSLLRKHIFGTVTVVEFIVVLVLVGAPAVVLSLYL